LGTDLRGPLLDRRRRRELAEHLASHDNGRRWHRLPELPPHAGEIVFTSARDDWLAEQGPSPSLYRTRDGGRHWREVQLPRPPGLANARTDYLAPRFEPDGRGILAATYETPELGLLNVDGDISPVAGTDLPTEYSPWLSFSGTEDGFGRIETERCKVTGKRARCKDINALYFTADGGATWTPTARP
jgi:hypothetical protein